MIPIQICQQAQLNYTKSCNSVIEKLKKKTQLIKSQQKRQLRKRMPSSMSENKFKNFMRKWNQAKKSYFKTLIPSTIFKVISSSDYIDIKQSKQDYEKVQKALKFYNDEIKELGSIGQNIFSKSLPRFPQVPSTLEIYQYNNKEVIIEPFNINFLQQSYMNHLDNKSNSYEAINHDYYDKI